MCVVSDAIDGADKVKESVLILPVHVGPDGRAYRCRLAARNGKRCIHVLFHCIEDNVKDQRQKSRALSFRIWLLQAGTTMDRPRTHGKLVLTPARIRLRMGPETSSVWQRKLPANSFRRDFQPRRARSLFSTFASFSLHFLSSRRGETLGAAAAHDGPLADLDLFTGVWSYTLNSRRETILPTSRKPRSLFHHGKRRAVVRAVLPSPRDCLGPTEIRLASHNTSRKLPRSSEVACGARVPASVDRDDEFVPTN